MKKQLQFTDEAIAQAAAKEMSEEQNGTGYAAVILSRGIYFVEDEPAMIRNWETMVSEYEAGVLITKS